MWLAVIIIFFFKLIPEALLPVASGRSGRSGNSIVIVVYFRSWIIRQNSGAVSCAVYFAEPPVSFCAQKIASHGNEICQNLLKKKKQNMFVKINIQRERWYNKFELWHPSSIDGAQSNATSLRRWSIWDGAICVWLDHMSRPIQII